jgi:hypothetical protein
MITKRQKTGEKWTCRPHFTDQSRRANFTVNNKNLSFRVTEQLNTNRYLNPNQNKFYNGIGRQLLCGAAHRDPIRASRKTPESRPNVRTRTNTWGEQERPHPREQRAEGQGGIRHLLGRRKVAARRRPHVQAQGPRHGALRRWSESRIRSTPARAGLRLRLRRQNKNKTEENRWAGAYRASAYLKALLRFSLPICLRTPSGINLFFSWGILFVSLQLILFGN